MTPTNIITFIQPRPQDGKREDTGDEVDQHHHTGKINHRNTSQENWLRNITLHHKH